MCFQPKNITVALVKSSVVPPPPPPPAAAAAPARAPAHADGKRASVVRGGGCGLDVAVAEKIAIKYDTDSEAKVLTWISAVTKLEPGDGQTFQSGSKKRVSIACAECKVQRRALFLSRTFFFSSGECSVP